MKGLHHVGITVKDLDASIGFYHDVLGLQFSNEPSPWFEGEELGPAVGVPGAALRQVSLLLGDTTLELLYQLPLRFAQAFEIGDRLVLNLNFSPKLISKCSISHSVE